MSRSIKKGPFVAPELYKRIEELNKAGEKKVLKTWSRSSTIFPSFVGHTIAVHDGRKQNIRVQVGSVTNTNTIHEAVLASAYGEPGATALPDMFVSYPKTVLALPDADILVDYRDYFSDAELDDFIPAFLAEGEIGEAPATVAVMPFAETDGSDFWYDEEYSRLDAYQGYELNLILPREIDGVQLTMIGGGMMNRA